MSKLTTKEKGQIQECLKQYVSKYPSQNKAAQSLTGTSSATVSSILQGKWKIYLMICGATLHRSWGQWQGQTGR